jgi:hypothetical protein
MAKPKVKEDPKVIIKKCKCGFKLTNANWSHVRKKYFCPNCMEDSDDVPKMWIVNDRNE